MLMPILYRKEPSSKSIDGLVAELRYLQQPREKILTIVQLEKCLDKYFGGGKEVSGKYLAGNTNNVGSAGSINQVLLADESEFLQLLEHEVGGRLAPTMERLAKKTFHKVVEAGLEKLADEAISSLRQPSAGGIVAPTTNPESDTPQLSI
eukprot:CAMPEP_0180717994 /NCGR_PEP_ID=MMETSP1038_2-20121128/14262_1 /TAXON_ID=632150 /ORGANISM="Azadinium spinosum, Strain 3D9" /LENGTH=149 /DNA_ID=CAMNT_0022750483 /DNA_START=198 /DNA_END=647 /DNA_ORIENTATION=+